MLQLEDIAAVQLAIKICNHSQLKKEIFRLPGSEYDANKKKVENTYAAIWEESKRKKQWHKVIEEKAAIIVESLKQSKQLQKKVAGIVPSIGMRILTWAEYHEKNLGFSRNFSFKIFNSSFFTPRGIVNCKKAAEEMMDNEILSIIQKYKLAHLYCMNDHIPDLYTQLTEKDKEEFYDSQDLYKFNQPDFVKFWSYYLKDEVDKLRGDTDPNLYWLQMAIKSGNKDVVEYFFEKTNFITDEGTIIYAALQAVNNTWRRFYNGEESLVPFEYYADVICFLFWKMSGQQQIQFLKEDIKGVHYYTHSGSSNVLRLFLRWPYQNYFMKVVRTMWNFLPESNCWSIVKEILFYIGAVKIHFMYGAEHKDYDYRKLLGEFWNEIPERNKRYILRDHTELNSVFNLGKRMLFALFTMKNFTYQDRINIRLILNSATAEEKDSIISPEVEKNICVELMKSGRWEILDEFVANCCTSKAEKEINQLKQEIIFSESGRDACRKMISHEKLTTVERAFKWCSLPEDKLTTFKKELLICSEGMQTCADLVITDQTELANEFTNWSLSSEEDIIQYKKDLINEIGIQICERLIYGVSTYNYGQIRNSRINRMIYFNGGKWEEVETFITWCFSSEDEIDNFKKFLAVKEPNASWIHLIRIHLRLMLAHEWEDAEILFAWLDLSSEEIRELKKETIFSEECMGQMIVFVEEDHFSQVTWEEIELFLRWCLADKDDVLEFRNRFDEVYGFKRYENRREYIPERRRNFLNQFYSLIWELLNDLCQQSENRERL